ncbi:carbohydrate porin [Flavihumibacter profundi]|uniref:carbohydrate porin n=1 Tax=Flavihumibacter profundi TaxID=2716883 RepID=UPI001CC5DC01|nr:carbohydrate porin [Flavihumibacter profundi]MBZ5857004.1 carbohydrate porin [Flavihumibacter profundi]
MKRTILLAALFCVVAVAMAQPAKDTLGNWSYHFQLTAVSQSHPSFSAKYSGENSLLSEREGGKLSVTTTLFVGRKLWKNASAYFNPEIAGGSGLSAARGIAGFTNGETFRIGSADPKLYIARFYLRQYIPLKNSAYAFVRSDDNQVAESIPTSRITITAGKISLSDYFDNNAYSHDPRSQFLNWSLMGNGGWDYPADTRGYTQGLVAELVKPGWAIRFSSALVPRKANGLELDYKVTKAHSETFEFEKNWELKRPGAVRFLLFRTASQAPTYIKTLTDIKVGDSTSVDVYTGVKEWKVYGGIKFGFGINAEQEISKSIGAFFKASWNDGKTATWAFTEIDHSASAGLHINGTGWKRPNDHIGIAEVVNGISHEHQDFLNAGLYGFIIGDGKLNYGAEAITELYYQAKLFTNFFLSADYQFVQNPAYNKDRGPVHVFAIRGHLEF